MMQRCYDPRTNGFHNYGGRGVIVCPDWHLFDNFLRDMGLRPEGRTLDRIDVYGNYEPINCKWSTHKEQMQNQRAKR